MLSAPYLRTPAVGQEIVRDAGPQDATPRPFGESGFADGPLDPELIFRVDNARGCFAILGLWIANIAVLILPLFVFAGTGWTLVAMAIEVAGIVLLGVILYRRRRYKRPSF